MFRMFRMVRKFRRGRIFRKIRMFRRFRMIRRVQWGGGKAGTLMWLSFCFFCKKLQNVAVKIELQRHSVAKAQGKL